MPQRSGGGGQELVPSSVVYAIFDGANPVAVWRKYRGMTQAQLAAAAGIKQSQVAMIERGKREGSIETRRAIARALNLNLDDLEPANQD